MVQIVVEEKPQVTLYFEPRHPVSEVADANVTLMCSSNNLIHGRHFKSVKWYLDGDLLKQVDKSPECLVPNITKSHCHVDPSKGSRKYTMYFNSRYTFSSIHNICKSFLWPFFWAAYSLAFQEMPTNSKYIYIAFYSLV